MIFKGYKYRIYPTSDQKLMFAKTFGSCRWLYNYALAKKIEAYKQTKKGLKTRLIQDELKHLKLQEETKWLAEVDSQAYMATLRNLDKAYANFFRRLKEKKSGKKIKVGFPKFKCRKNEQRFQCPNNTRHIDWEKSTLTIPKIIDIPIVLSRTFEGRIKTVTIIRKPSGKYYASILVETPDNIPAKPEIKNAIGIDLGVKDFAVDSEGNKYPNPKHLKSSIRRLNTLQRRLSYKQKGSRNWDKHRIRISDFHEKITNQRNDYLHKLSYRLVCENQADTVCIESLSVVNMVKNRRLAQSISDAGWGKFGQYLKYKCDWYGKNLLQSGAFEPTSKTCSKCGTINHELKLSDRSWICQKCGAIHDRDVNAAVNIRNSALNKTNREAISRINACGEGVRPHSDMGQSSLKQEVPIL